MSRPTGRPVGPEHRAPRTPDPTPVAVPLEQPTAHDAYADIAGRNDPAAAPRDTDLEPDARLAGELLRAPADVPVVPASDLRRPAPDVRDVGSHAAYADLPGARAAAPTRDDATPAPADHSLTIARADGSLAWVVALDPAVVADLDAETPDVAAAGYRLAGAYAIADADPVSGVYVISPPAASTCRRATAVLHAMAEVDVDRERDRAARWASELADAENLLATSVAADPAIPSEPGDPLAQRIDAAITQAYADGVADGKRDGVLETAAAVDVEVLTRAVHAAEAQPVEPVDDPGRLTAERVRVHLAGELGWRA